MRTRTHLLAATLLFALSAGCMDLTSPASEGVVVFAFDNHPADTLRVRVRNSRTLEEARRFLAGRSRANIPVGPIVRGEGADPRYPFHFIADSVRLAEVAGAECDGRPPRTPAEVDAVFGTAARVLWCPWGARPIAVE